ncbi:MAG: HipA domain-containing protein [Deltaproteobacteria bacterium]|nr:HipA domain-containing protein [Deltaproteobacteria bacterium]
MKLADVRKLERVYVFKGEELAGSITRTRDGSIFEYDAHYLERAGTEDLASVAFSLPLRKEPHQTYGDNLHPFFAGLLPEGRRLSALISALKTSADDMFSLLAGAGSDCIGDVFISHDITINETDNSQSSFDLDQALFVDLFEQSIASTEFSERKRDISVPGVQPKISAEMISFPIAIKKNHKRYLLKLAPQSYPKLIENEHFFMKMAHGCGIECAKTSIVHDRNGTPGLLVERFDRCWQDESKTIKRLHQEDACQFLARYPQDKYRLSMRQIADGIVKYSSSPIIETAKLLKLTAFSYLIANGDLHAKNISLLQPHNSSSIILSPAYDLLSTLPYGDEQMALELERRRTKLFPKHFIIWAERSAVKRAAAISILCKLCGLARPYVEQLEEIGLEPKKTNYLRQTMLKRISQLSGEP